MPRRREVLPEVLNKIIKLRQSKTSWLQIQRDTQVPRQIAKRAYETWEHSQSKEKLTQARIQVATNLLNEHVWHIIRFAETLVYHIPESMMFLETRDAETVLTDIWGRDLLDRERESVFSISLQPETERTQRRVLRQNEILFRSLRDHTQGKVDWQALGSWKESWNTCRFALEELRSKADESVQSILSNQKQNARKTIMAREDATSVMTNMVNGVIEVLWRAMQNNALERIADIVQVKLMNGGSVVIVFGESGSTTRIELADSDLAEDIAHICRWAARNLYIEEKDKQIARYKNGIRTMKEAINELEESLNPFRLRSMIIRTECDLCPA